MRNKQTENGITLKVYAGTTGVLLAMNVTDDKRVGLLGFAIRRKKEDGSWRYLRGLLGFDRGEPPTYKPISSRQGPIQKFRWSDYTVQPDTKYSYNVRAVYGSPENLDYVAGPVSEVKTEPITRGKHRIIFNRAVAASQAYTRRFGDTNPDDSHFPLYLEARKWLTRGMLEKIEQFIKRAKDENYTLDLALFEFEYDGFVELLQKVADKGVRIKVVYHGQPGDKQTIANEHHLLPLNDEQKFPRPTTALFHQKFIILKKKDANGVYQPQAVLTGTANFTPNGLWRQANVIHIINDKKLAEQYDVLFKQLLTSQSRGDTKKHINAHHPIKTNKKLFNAFSPRSKYLDIDFLENAIRSAKSEIFICSAFRIHDRITTALEAANENVIRYGLQNSRTSITGFHRNKSFTTPAFLKKGLENFLKESSKGQRGNIYIHLKTMVLDFTTDKPVVIVGSHNFSKSASDKNDENFVVIKGDTEVADTYFCEMMRLYDHYRFRYNQKVKGSDQNTGLYLCPDDSWTDSYFDPLTLKFEERERFSK